MSKCKDKHLQTAKYILYIYNILIYYIYIKLIILKILLFLHFTFLHFTVAHSLGNNYFCYGLRNQTKNTIFAARFFIDFYLWELIVFSCRQSVRITGSFCLWLFRVPASSAYSQRHLLAVFLALARYIVHSLRKLFPNVLLYVSRKNVIFAVPILKHYKNQNPK